MKIFRDREPHLYYLVNSSNPRSRWKIEANVTYAYPTDFEDNGEPKCGEKDKFTIEGPWFFVTSVDVKKVLSNSTAITEYTRDGKSLGFKLDPAPMHQVIVSRSAAGPRHDACWLLSLSALSWLWLLL